MTLFILKLAEYTKFPFARYSVHGPHSAEEFRTDWLIPALQENYQIILDLNDVTGFPGSWTEEVFGGLIRNHGYTATELRERLSIDVRDGLVEHEIWHYIESAEK
ncbi:STAS-like domain-containing protein [Pseudomonas congelans]|uniref:STAS-like domain-containing protein n=1 Tax=Pseudomonas congelans TaxID=200452 RepID=UPI001BDDC2E2|nr:STAS-like domain-containing protein [Pseudomonas congelans]QVX16661.1 STAS-like domain-containing protein [Pseudomonas congelans]